MGEDDGENEGAGTGEEQPRDVGLDAHVTYYFSFSSDTMYVYKAQDDAADDYVVTYPVTDGSLRDGDYGDVLWDTRELEINRRGNADDDAAGHPSKGKERNRFTLLTMTTSRTRWSRPSSRGTGSTVAAATSMSMRRLASPTRASSPSGACRSTTTAP